MKQQSNTLDIEKCVRQAGNKFDLILIASARVRELHNGRAPLIKTDNKGCVTALTEIEQGLVGRDMLRK
ncbi:MAG: DNA-directed RNA polymerase subunit omega, partial [Proteobacteria bacterium]|nr:DNA-directed RNA polymerase subunit omega [Pseudomonadota bacterium]